MVYGKHELFSAFCGVFEVLSFLPSLLPAKTSSSIALVTHLDHQERTNHAHSLLLDRQRHPVICFVDPPSIASLVHCIRWNQSKLVLIFSFFLQEEKNKNEKKVPQLKNTQKYTASLW